MASRRWLRGQSDVTVSLSTPRPLTALGGSLSTGASKQVRRVYEDFATALPGTRSPAVTGDPAGHRPQYRCGHVQPGTIRHSGLPGEAGIGFGETIFVPRARVLFTHPTSTSQNGYPDLKPGEKTSVDCRCAVAQS